MISKLRKGKALRIWCFTVLLNFVAELVIPAQAFALTGGPKQPEFSSFTPVGVSDMVDLSSGDLNYNIPLLDVGGYPINIAYNSGIGADDEASWVGLGWTLSAGQINRNVRGLPDDFRGDEMTYENYLKPNVTVGASFAVTPHLAGVGLDQFADENSLSFGVTATVNNYTGYSLAPNVGANFGLTKNLSVGFNVSSSADGLCVSPNVSIHHKGKVSDGRNRKIGANVGATWNSRAGMSQMTMGVRTKIDSERFPPEDNMKEFGAIGSTIGFTDQIYTPSKRVGMITASFTVNAAVGSELFLGEGQGQITAYGTKTEIQASEKTKTAKAYGYSNTEHANNYSILDFNREKEGALSVNSTNLPITNYTYDIYSIQGQGVSGMYRPFRNKVGYVYDPFVQDFSTSGTLGLEFGAGNAVHVGVDLDVTQVSSHSGNWSQTFTNQLLQYISQSQSVGLDYEPVHYKNVGDLSVDRDWQIFTNQIGDYAPVRGDIIGSKFNRVGENRLMKKMNANTEQHIPVQGPIQRNKRHYRNQAIYNLTKAQLDDGIGYGPMSYDTPEYAPSAEAKPHHINEVQIIRNDGARYIYGLPAYNNIKKEATFAVTGSSNPSASTGLVQYAPANLSSPFTGLPNDQYFNRITTPGYVHSHLLTSVLSTDYSDLTGDGPSPDDLGSYTKFTYEREDDAYHWRIPFEQNMANYNEGLVTNPEDDQASYIYGTKELHYIKKIETKTHVAIFDYSPRRDGKGVLGEHGGKNDAEVTMKLDKISLYSIEEYDPITPGTPIKEVHFEYSYSLCPGIPNTVTGFSDNEVSNAGGKLTLKKIYFTYRNSKMGKYMGYRFNYNEYVGGEDEYSNTGPLVLNTPGASGGTGENPAYHIKGYDTWGNYKPFEGTPGFTGDPLTPEYPFTEQDSTVQGLRSAVWCLKKVHTPSGGVISIDYESDDYASVQDRATMKMYKVVAAGDSEDGASFVSGQNNFLYDQSNPKDHFDYLYAEVDPNEQISTNSGEIKNKYFPNSSDLLQFRFYLNMTQQGGSGTEHNGIKGDYVSGYCKVDLDKPFEIFSSGGSKYISIPVELVDKEGGLTGSGQDVNPIAKAGWNFGRKYLNKFVYGMAPMGDPNDIESSVNQLVAPQVIQNLLEIFKGPNGTLMTKNIARRFARNKSFVRMVIPDKSKLGGGSRVARIGMSDRWSEMNPGQTGYQSMTYGQRYIYKLDANTDVSSGVATYEPVGNKENPFVRPVFSTTEHLLAPDEENYVEEPFGESFFPSPQVTYSRVQVSSTSSGEGPVGHQIKKLNRTGSVVTEFYTSKDFPTVVDQTRMEAFGDEANVLDNLLKKSVKNHFTASQGFVIHLNDMNGKQKAQWVYAEGQSAPISGVEYKYRTHGSQPGYTASSGPSSNHGKLNNTVKVINPDGTIQMKSIGVEYDVVVDFMENATLSTTASMNMNVASFFAAIIPAIVPIPLPDIGTSQDQFRGISTTKVINTFGILEETIAHDAGASVSTKNLAWDALTGEVLVTQTVDEYHDKYYTFNYPAHWYYNGMGHATKNLGLKGTLDPDGTGYEMPYAFNYLIPGDELHIGSGNIVWVSSVNGGIFTLIDEDGDAVTGLTDDFEVVRSGNRNLQSAGIMNVTLMQNPLKNVAGNDLMSIPYNFLTSSNWEDWKIINAGAVDYSSYWRVGCECEINTLSGSYNPYRYNERGVWRTKSSRTYLTGRNKQADVTPRQEGFFSKFSPMYKRSIGGHWSKNINNWTFVAEVSRYSPYGFELENEDALGRYSAAQYGYNNTFPMAVGANSEYRQIGFDGFEDHGFDGCDINRHFSYIDAESAPTLEEKVSHTGRYSLKVAPSGVSELIKPLSCED